MEGIADGMAVDDCFYCTILYPSLDDCPKCGNRFRYRPAQMRSSDCIEPAISSAIAAFSSAPSTQSAAALLTLWHELDEEAASFAIAERVALGELRAHFDVPLQTSAVSDREDDEAPTS